MELVAPIIPDAQKNLSATLALQALGTGLQAAARFAQMRRDSEMDVAKLAANEHIATEEHALKQQQLDQNYEIAQATLESSQLLNEAHADYYKAGAKAYAEGTKTAAQRAIAFNQQRQEVVNDVNDQATKLQLDDPNFATKEPVKYAANVLKFQDMFQLSPLPEVKNAITQYRRIADQQKIPIRTGVTDEDGMLKPSGEAKMVPIWQVVKHMNDPLFQEQTMRDLEASGHTSIVNEFTDVGGKKVPTTKKEPTPIIKTYLEKGKGVDFTPVPSRVPSAMLPKGASAGTTPTEMPVDIPQDTTTDPQASATPQYQPTDTDNFLGMAKAAIARGAPLQGVAAKLQELGIDPQQLFAT